MKKGSSAGEKPLYCQARSPADERPEDTWAKDPINTRAYYAEAVNSIASRPAGGSPAYSAPSTAREPASSTLAKNASARPWPQPWVQRREMLR